MAPPSDVPPEGPDEHADQGHVDGQQDREEEPQTKREEYWGPREKRTDLYPELNDFYNTFDDLDVTPQDRRQFLEALEKLEQRQKELLETKMNFYVVNFENVGGLVMPLLLDIVYEDGSEEELRIPAEIWRFHPTRTAKLFVTQKEIASIEVDPHLETADADRSNNYWPSRPVKSRFQLFKERKDPNDLQAAREAEGLDDDGNEK